MGSQRRGWRRWMTGLWAIVLSGLITACYSASIVPPAVVQQAIIMQVQESSIRLTQQLKLSSSAPSIVQVRRVRLLHQEPLTIEGRSAWHLQGTYDLLLKWPDTSLKPLRQIANSFDLYLQSQVEGKSWRLARQIVDPREGIRWVTQRVESPA